MFYIVIYVKISNETKLHNAYLLGYLGDSKTMYLLMKLDSSLMDNELFI